MALSFIAQLKLLLWGPASGMRTRTSRAI